MTSAAITYAEVSARLEHPVARVWDRIAAFGGLELWVDGVSDCTVEGDGVGAVRTVVRNGNSVRERLEEIDPRSHMIRYRILPPHSIPADNVCGSILLQELADGATEMVWRSDATDFHVEPDMLGERISAFYGASIQGLARLLDGAGAEA